MDVPIVKSVRSRKRVDRDEQAVHELVVEDLEVGAQRVPLDLGEVGLDVRVERDALRAQAWCSVLSETVGLLSDSCLNSHFPRPLNGKFYFF